MALVRDCEASELVEGHLFEGQTRNIDSGFQLQSVADNRRVVGNLNASRPLSQPAEPDPLKIQRVLKLLNDLGLCQERFSRIGIESCYEVA